MIAQRGKPNRQWAYFPDLDLVRPIAGRSQDDPFLGSDMTYADLAGGAHLGDLLHRLVGEEMVGETPCYLMEGIPRHRILYGKIRGWVRKDNFVTVRALFYDQQGKPMKEATLEDIRMSPPALMPSKVRLHHTCRNPRAWTLSTATRLI